VDGRKRRIGILMPFDPQDAFGKDGLAALLGGLRGLGWEDGRNLAVDVRWIGGDEDRRRTLASELVRTSPDVIFACFQAQLAALSRETRTIPIVFVGVSDPVGGDYAGSYAHPGGNITGFTFFEPSLVGAWLGVLKEMVPSLNRVALIFNPETTMRRGARYLEELKSVATTAHVEPVAATVGSVEGIAAAVEVLAREPHSGLIVAPDTFTTLHFKLIVDLAAQHRVPTIYQFRPPVAAGGLVSYGPDQINVFRQSASYIDQILRGAKVGDLPIQAPTRFKLVINLRTARTLGLTVPTSLLARADEVIE
jgi:putative ABC transport system substrate-binding protein